MIAFLIGLGPKTLLLTISSNLMVLTLNDKEIEEVDWRVGPPLINVA